MSISVVKMENIYQFQQNNTLCKEVLEFANESLRPGMNELELFKNLKTFILNHPDIDSIWHPIVVKFDQSTLNVGVKHKPSESVVFNEIAIVDIGIVSAGIELDDAKTFGASQNAKDLIAVIDPIMMSFREFVLNSKSSPKEAYFELTKIARNYGVKQIAQDAGHILGVFPTMKSKIKIRESEEAKSFTNGSWMLEVHISDGKIGAFKEELVYIDNRVDI